MRIGGVTLHALHGDRAGNGTAPADLDHVAELVGIGRLPDEAGIPALTALSRPLQQLDRAVDGGAFLVAGNQERDGALRRAVLFDVAGDGGDEAGDAALHVDGAAAEHLPPGNLRAERVMRPGGCIADGHDVRMAGEHQVRSLCADAGIEVLDIGRIGLRRDHAFHHEAEGLQHGGKRGQRTALGWSHRGAADERGEILDRIGRGHEARSQCMRTGRIEM